MNPAATATFHSARYTPREENSLQQDMIQVTLDPVIAKMVAEHQSANYNEPEAEPEFCFAIRPLNILV